MNAEQLRDELDTINGEVFVEINGVDHPIHAIREDSQGIYLMVDRDQEEREMR
jgi:hypothetical protein